MTRIAWWHCAAGASGDMCLGALVDAGAPLEAMQDAVDAIGTERVTLAAEEVTRGGLAATQVHVDAPPSTVVRTWPHVRQLLAEAALPDALRRTASAVFERLAVAEAAVHRSTPEQVHFHEVGALDAIADVVGTAAGLHALGIETAAASPVALGIGMTRSEHGLLPVPAPAVLTLLEAAGAPVYSGDVPHELCTPTGAAILAATVTTWGGLPPMRISATGTGAGGRDLGDVPNVLRIVVGDALPAATSATDPMASDPMASDLVLEANVDDLDPRLWPAVLARLLDAGAADAWLTPILMKKGRPAHTLHVLAAPESAEGIRRVVFTETSTIGIRETRVAKRALSRDWTEVAVDGEPVRVKTASLDGVVVNVAPEYDDVLRAAAALGRPVKAVLAAAVAAAHAAGLMP